MSKLRELKSRYEELEHEMASLEIEIERLEEEEKEKAENKRWRAVRTGLYYFVSSGGEVGTDTDWRSGEDELRYEMGNYFKTKEEAEHWVETLRVWAELKVYSIDKTNTEDDRYYIHFDCHYNVFCFELGMGSTAHAELAFPTIGRVKQAIKEVGEERVKRYYLGVK